MGFAALGWISVDQGGHTA